MLIRILPESTVSPASSTLAGMEWRMKIVVSVVWSSSVPFSAMRWTPEMMGWEAFDPMPFDTIASACASEDWLTVNFIGPCPFLIYIDI